MLPSRETTLCRRWRFSTSAASRYLLFSDEAKLTDKLVGTSTFAADFAKRGPCDRRGRSLRVFDLDLRLFKYPCSYLVHSEAFEQLPAAMKDYVYRQLHHMLTGRVSGREYEHLSAEDRQAILEILRETKPGLSDYWRR